MAPGPALSLNPIYRPQRTHSVDENDIELSEMDDLREWTPSGLEVPSKALQLGRNEPVVIDFGSALTRVGVAKNSVPSHEFITKAARYRERKSGEQRTVVGNDILLDQGSKSSVRSPFDGPLLTNWDPAESILDYSLNLVGYDVNKPSPIAISEALLLPHLAHRTLQELLFEGYAAPKAMFAADVLAASKYVESLPQTNTSQTSTSQTSSSDEDDHLFVFIGAESTHVVPIVKGKPQRQDIRRIRFGGRSATEYLHNLLILKYPNFPVPVTPGEVELMLRNHCFVAQDYAESVSKMMDLDFLSEFQVRIQAPYPSEPQRDLEQEKRQAERRKESGRRLQEQAAIARIERQGRQQKQLDELTQWETELMEMERPDAEEQARIAGFTDLVDVRRTIKQLSNNLKRSRGEVIEDPEPSTPLLNVPDAELNEEQIKDKRRQKLLRASYDARQRARAAKEAKQQAEAAAEAAEVEWRTNDLRGWATAKRAQLMELLSVIREREKIKNDPRLRFRHTLMEGGDLPKPKRTKQSTPASIAPSIKSEDMRMKSESVEPNGSETANGSPVTTSGDVANSSAANGSSGANGSSAANGSSGASVVTSASSTGSSYGNNTQSSDSAAYDVLDDEEEAEEEPDYEAEADALKALLLEHDPQFNLEELEPQRNWRNSTVHKFLWGAQPYDPENIPQNYQLNLNIERIRAVEPLFQPSMVGLDQAGLSEVCSDLLKKYPRLTKSIQISGGFASINGLPERLTKDLRRELPVDVEVQVQRTEEPQLDAWRGLAKLSLNPALYITRKEYEENGPDFVKPHQWI